MRNRPLINQSCLQKISGKAQHFMIRNKLSLSKGPRPQRTPSHPDLHQLNLQQEGLICTEIMEKWLEDGQQLCREDGKRVIRFIKEVKNKWNEAESSIGQQEFEQSNPSLIKARNNSRARMETYDDAIENHSGDRANNFELVLTKTKSTKLKLGKENVNRNPVLWEMRLERLQGKLEQSELKSQQYQTKINSLKQQILTLNSKQLQFEQELAKIQKEKHEIGQKASALVLQKIQLESDLKMQLLELEHKMEDSKTMRKVLEDRLNQRQKEMVALYQTNQF